MAWPRRSAFALTAFVSIAAAACDLELFGEYDLCEGRSGGISSDIEGRWIGLLSTQSLDLSLARGECPGWYAGRWTWGTVTGWAYNEMMYKAGPTLYLDNDGGYSPKVVQLRELNRDGDELSGHAYGSWTLAADTALSLGSFDGVAFTLTKH